SAGTYYVWGIADNSGILSQSGGDNDFTRSAALTVSTVTLHPDLVITSLNVSPSSFHPGDQVTVSFTVYNQGTGSAGQTTTELRLNQATVRPIPFTGVLADVVTPALAAGAQTTLSTQVTIPGSTSAGT